MQSGKYSVIAVIVGGVFGSSSLVRSADFAAPELLDAVADTPRGSALKVPAEVSDNQVEAAFLALNLALRLNPLSGQPQSATLNSVDSFREKLTKKQADGLRSLADGFAQKLKSGEVKVATTADSEPKPKLTGAEAASDEPPCIDRGMPWHHPRGMSGNHMGWGMWHVNDDYHRDRMGHEWWDWNSSLSRWGASLYMSRGYLQLKCLNDDNMKETISMPAWFEAVITKLPCPQEPVARMCPRESVHILWNDQYWLAK